MSNGVNAMPSVVSTHEKSTLLPSEIDVPHQEFEHHNVAELAAPEVRRLFQ